jgi:hypothetical protein
MNGFRWLTVGPAGDDGASLVLMTVPAQPVFYEAASDQIHALLGEGAWGRNCADAELAARGVKFTQLPTEQPHGIDAGFCDPRGNQFRML